MKQVALGLKIFGNELKHVTFDGKENILSALRKLNPMVYLKDILSGKVSTYVPQSLAVYNISIIVGNQLQQGNNVPGQQLRRFYRLWISANVKRHGYGSHQPQTLRITQGPKFLQERSDESHRKLQPQRSFGHSGHHVS